MSQSIYIKKVAFSKSTLNFYTKIIDVRTPSEFNDDAIPSAVNIPVLNNTEREYIGKVYKNNIFEARKIGAQIITKKISNLIKKNIFQKKDKILIYCWRGGLRSLSLYLILKNIGFDVTLLDKGYKNYRRFILDFFNIEILNYRFNILGGLTGSGKTYFLNKLSNYKKVLNLELIANHKGSVLGEIPNKTQPSQKLFESQLWFSLYKYGNSESIWVESESRKIGKLSLPNNLFSQMKVGKFYTLDIPLNERIKFIMKDYKYFINQPNILKEKITLLKKFLSNEEYAKMINFIDSKKIKELVKNLLSFHYDKLYNNRSFYKENKKKIELSSVNLNSFNSLLIKLNIKKKI